MIGAVETWQAVRPIQHRPLAWTASLLLAGLSGCAVGPSYTPAKISDLGVPPAYSVPVDASPREDLSRWWSGFDDPLLVRLVDEGRRSNLDVAIALSRLRQAREALVQARAGNFPGVTASGSAGRTGAISGSAAGLPASNFSLGVDAAYQADIFGGRARSIEAARAEANASGYDYGAAIVSVQSEIATNYLLARLQQAQLDNARQTLANEDDNLQIARWRNMAGLTSALDVEQARAQRAQTAASIPPIETNFNQAVSRLGVLLGQAPGAVKSEFTVTAPIPHGPLAVAVGIPADVMRQRPDVRSAERALAAATARIGVAEAQLYPALTLGGSINAKSPSLHSLFDLVTGNLFANLAQVIFDGGRLRSQVRAQRAATDGAFAAYKRTVLTAIEDVENASMALRSADEREAEYRTALDAAGNSALYAREQYRSGLIDFTSLLGAENQLLSARNGLAQAQYDRASALVQLFTALGGGWNEQETAAPAVTSASTRQDQ